VFGKGAVEEASNPLILMHTKELKRDLQHSEKRYSQNFTQYSNFHHSLEKAVRIDFLNNRKFSSTELGVKKRKSLKV
jgi:dihydropteroate synthase